MQHQSGIVIQDLSVLTKHILYAAVLCLQFEKHQPNERKCGFLIFEKLRKLYYVIQTLNCGKITLASKINVLATSSVIDDGFPQS